MTTTATPDQMTATVEALLACVEDWRVALAADPETDGGAQ